MVSVINRKSVMTLFADPTCHYSHRTRYVLSEKSTSSEVIYVDPKDIPEDLLELNPYNTLPILLDRDLALFNSRIIMEYLDERFPHPPLYPVDPVSRARSRLMIHRIDQDWYTLFDDVVNAGEKKAAKAKKLLRENLIAADPVFAAKPFFMSDEFSLVDCVLAPLLWRLPIYGIDLPNSCRGVREYSKRILNRDGFQRSLSNLERELTEVESLRIA